MMNPIRNRHTSRKLAHGEAENGSAVVEGAMIFGLFFFLIFAIIEFGMFFMAWTTGRNAATESAHEAAVAGADGRSDFYAMDAVRANLNRLGGSLDYLIVYRAKSIKATAPIECINEAESKRTVSATAQLDPVGVFIDNNGGSNVELFNWSGSARPKVACNIYYRRHLALIKESFGYDKLAIEAGNPPSADRYWPANKRIDKLIGPVDLLGIHVSQSYASTTGIIPSRRLNHDAVIQIESRTSQ